MMKRIVWLDASRGLAVLLLILMHYVGALESRNFISKDTLDVIYGLLRLGTPFFMFAFGLAFFITASSKIEKTGLRDYYISNVLKRVCYILIGREVIVLILAFKYPEMAENLVSILLFQEFSKGGEILIFYLFAFMVAPLNVIFVNKVSTLTYSVMWLSIYAISYWIGANFVTAQSNNFLRFLFYDVYAFFPFLLVVAIAMLLAKHFLASSNRDKYIRMGLIVGLLACLLGFIGFTVISDHVWLSLSSAEYKKPPNLFYMLFYLGEVFIVIALVALTIHKLPAFINTILSVLGRNTLVSYVVHYTFFASVPLAAVFGGGALIEVISLIAICVTSYFGVKLWDTHKTKKKLLARNAVS